MAISIGTAEASPTKAFSTIAPTAIHKQPTAAATARVLAPGSLVCRTDKRGGLWWEVADENGNVGRVLDTTLAPTQ